LDGKPIEDASIAFDGSRLGASGEVGRVLSQGIRVGPEGRFKATLWPGEYRLNAQFSLGERHLLMHDAGLIRVTPGEKLKHTFDLRSSVLKLRVVGSDGTTAVAGINLDLRIAPPAWPVGTGRTDARGMVEVEGLPAGPATILVRPKRLSTDEAVREFYRLGKEKMEDVLVRVASIDITPPETVATIVLPASAGY
jgi:hypothetical protein